VRARIMAGAFSRSSSRIVARCAIQSVRNLRDRSESRHLDSCREERVMLQEGSQSIDDGRPMWDGAPNLDWRAVDRALRGIARRRSALDAEEVRWLREAERLQI